MYKLWLIGFLFGALGLSVKAQPHPILDNFIVFRVGNTIQLKWTITSGATCNGIKIYRAQDSVSFVEVGDISGICGNSTSPVPYSYTDLTPIPNKINYYRLELGTLGFSKFSSVNFIVLGEGGYLISPQPVTESTVIYFDNPSGNSFSFRLYNSSGQLVNVIENITGSSFPFSSLGIHRGVHIFTIELKNRIQVKGKIVVP